MNAYLESAESADVSSEYRVVISKPKRTRKPRLKGVKEDMRGITNAKLKQLIDEPHNPDTGLEVNPEAAFNELCARLDKLSHSEVTALERQWYGQEYFDNFVGGETEFSFTFQGLMEALGVRNVPPPFAPNPFTPPRFTEISEII